MPDYPQNYPFALKSKGVVPFFSFIRHLFWHSTVISHLILHIDPGYRRFHAYFGFAYFSKKANNLLMNACRQVINAFQVANASHIQHQ
jgi:hypothetical protein